MMRLMRVTKRGPNIQLGDKLYQLSSGRGASSNNVTVAMLRLANDYSPAGWPIELVVDADGGREIIKAMAVPLMTDFEPGGDFQTKRRQQHHKAAEFLRQIAADLDAVK